MSERDSLASLLAPRGVVPVWIAAAYLGVTPHHVRRLFKAGKLPGTTYQGVPFVFVDTMINRKRRLGFKVVRRQAAKPVV